MKILVDIKGEKEKFLTRVNFHTLKKGETIVPQSMVN